MDYWTLISIQVVFFKRLSLSYYRNDETSIQNNCRHLLANQNGAFNKRYKQKDIVFFLTITLEAIFKAPNQLPVSQTAKSTPSINIKVSEERH